MKKRINKLLKHAPSQFTRHDTVQSAEKTPYKSSPQRADNVKAPVEPISIEGALDEPLALTTPVVVMPEVAVEQVRIESVLDETLAPKAPMIEALEAPVGPISTDNAVHDFVAPITAIGDVPESPVEPSTSVTAEVTPTSTLAADGKERQSQNMSGEKKKEPQDFLEYIEFFYQGKILSLPEALVRRLRGISQEASPEARSALQTKALEADPTLEKTRQLMLISRQARPNIALESTLREFAATMVALSLARTSTAIGRSVLFPSSGEGKSLKKIWCDLGLDIPEEKSPKTKIDKTIPHETPESLSAVENSNKAKNTSKVRRNAYLCAVLWRRGDDGTSFGDIHRVLRETTLDMKTPRNIEDALLDSLISLSSSESKKVGLYAEWAGQSIQTQSNINSVLKEQLRLEKDEVERLNIEIENRALLLAEKDEILGNLAEELARVKDALAVQKVHTRADYEGLRARSLGILKGEVNELVNVEIALSRPIPKVETAKDVVKVVVNTLQAYINDLEEKR